jgi:MFS family permease
MTPLTEKPLLIVPPPTKVRYSILALLCLLAMITYMDRAANGSAKNEIMHAVGITDVADYAIILSAFQIAYALFEIPTGWLGDRFGPRSTLLRIVLWWSLFVALTGCAGLKLPGSETALIGFTGLIVVQFLFGIGEAGAFPNISKALYNWFPLEQRGFAQGAIWLAARLMGGLTPFIWVLLTVVIGIEWRTALWGFAAVAAAWAVVFWWWFRNHPDDHPATNITEQELIRRGKPKATKYAGVPWVRIFTSRNLWFMCLMYMVTNFNWYFLMYFFPTSLPEQFPEWKATTGGRLMLAVIGGAPLLVGMFGCWLGGRLTDSFIRRTGDRKWGRRVYGMMGYGLAATFYLCAAFVTDSFWVFAACLILVGFSNDLMMAPSWATTQDIGRRYAAIVAGTMNMVGNLGGALGIRVTGAVLGSYGAAGKLTDGYIMCFLIYAGVYAFGVLTWLFIDPTKPVVPEEPDAVGGST